MLQTDSVIKIPCADPVPDNALSLLNIDLGAVAHNYSLIQEKVGGTCRVGAVVKANAYGLGMERLSRTLAQQNCKTFFVATIDEALSLHSILPEAEIVMLNGILPGIEDEYVRNNITPVLNSPGEIELWNNTAEKYEKQLQAGIHFDTGINRLGLPPYETGDLLENTEEFDGLNISMVLSHFACADEKDNNMTHGQYGLFQEIAKHFPNTRKSLANSSGIFRSDNYHFDLVRPGMSLYGLNPTPETSSPMKPVITLDAKILQIRTVPKGSFVGYGATHCFDKGTMLATVALGYADGFFRALGNKAKLYYKGAPCPVVGQVSMDLVTVDMGSHQPQPGEMLEVIGPNQSADDLAEMAGTIGYEVLTSLGRRHYRHYLA